MCPIDDLLQQAIQKTVDDHLARLLYVHRPGTGYALTILIATSLSTPEPEVSITLHAAGSTVNEQFKLITTIRHENVVNWLAWSAKAAPAIASLISAIIPTIFPSGSIITSLSIFINSELERSIIEKLLFDLSGYTKLDTLLETVYLTISTIDADIAEFRRLHQDWNAIRHLS
jgi:hypothetical protein